MALNLFRGSPVEAVRAGDPRQLAVFSITPVAISLVDYSSGYGKSFLVGYEQTRRVRKRNMRPPYMIGHTMGGPPQLRTRKQKRRTRAAVAQQNGGGAKTRARPP